MNVAATAAAGTTQLQQRGQQHHLSSKPLYYEAFVLSIGAQSGFCSWTRRPPSLLWLSVCEMALVISLPSCCCRSNNNSSNIHAQPTKAQQHQAVGPGCNCMHQQAAATQHRGSTQQAESHFRKKSTPSNFHMAHTNNSNDDDDQKQQQQRHAETTREERRASLGKDSHELRTCRDNFKHI